MSYIDCNDGDAPSTIRSRTPFKMLSNCSFSF